MRIGLNPNKDKINSENIFFHQIIIPVYIPNHVGYFKEGLQILQFCIESLLKTCHNKTYITIINNGSCIEVVEYLNNLFRNNKIHEIIHTTNIGKLNSILKGIKGHDFPLVTITDADVMFLNNWQKETYAVFESFPKAGAVSPAPSPKVLKHLTYNIIFKYFFSKKLYFSKTKEPKFLEYFAKSIGNPDFYNQYHLEKSLTLNLNNTKAIIGAGHFVATYNGKIFDQIKMKFSKYNLGGDSENILLDKPVAKQGFWRLSTEETFACHMGNVTETWMQQVLSNLKDQSQNIFEKPKLHSFKQSKFISWIQSQVFYRILSKKTFWIWFLQHKGLSKKAAKNY